MLYRTILAASLAALCTSGPTVAAPPPDACTADGGSLGSAIRAYAAACDAPRVDCDPVTGGWTCSSVRFGSNGSAVPTPLERAASVPTLPARPDASGQCRFTATTLPEAINGYDGLCMAPRVDCDPVAGRWTCSSGVVGSAAPGRAAVASVKPVATLVNIGGTYRGRGPGGRSWSDSYIGTDGQCWPRSSFDHGIGTVLVTTSTGERVTIREAARRLGRGPAQSGDLEFNSIACGQPPYNSAGDEDRDQCPGLTLRGTAGCRLVADVPGWWQRVR